jgi:DNA-binding MarR family transcriptional regulator
MFRGDDNLASVKAQPPSPGRDRVAGTRTATVSRDEAFETSRLLVELLHAAHASRRSAEPAAPDAQGPRGLHEEQASAHAIRAAIHLYQHGERTVGQLAAGLGISRGWASRVAEELVERGRVSRQSDPDDRRVVRLRLTEGSLAEIERAYRWRGDVVAAALAEHGPAERDAIRRFLRRVAADLSSEATGSRSPQRSDRPGSRDERDADREREREDDPVPQQHDPDPEARREAPVEKGSDRREERLPDE